MSKGTTVASACRFYQHVQGGSAWDWKIVWAHASSSDLVHWRHEPMALQPTPGGLDGQGCWSGNTMLDENGVPTILYTMVRSVNSHPVAQPQPFLALHADSQCQHVKVVEDGLPDPRVKVHGSIEACPALGQHSA